MSQIIIETGIDSEGLYTVKEIADMLYCSERAIQRDIKLKRLPGIKSGTFQPFYIIKGEDLINYLLKEKLMDKFHVIKFKL